MELVMGDGGVFEVDAGEPQHITNTNFAKFLSLLESASQPQ